MKIEFVNVSKEFYDLSDKITIFSNLNFLIPEGKIISLYGDNGSGKSTLALLSTLFLKPNNGYIKFDDFTFDEKTKKRELKELRQKIKILFQDINLQIFKPTIEEEIKFSFTEYLKIKKIKNDEKEKFLNEKVDFLFKIINFPNEYKKRSPYNLSGGEKRKLIVGCLLITPTEFLVLDEPTIGLDLKTKNEFVNFIKEVNEKFNTTILLITHDKKILNEFDHKITMDELKQNN